MQNNHMAAVSHVLATASSLTWGLGPTVSVGKSIPSLIIYYSMMTHNGGGGEKTIQTTHH